MKAYEARSIAYEKNKAAKGLKRIQKLIEKASRDGKFSIQVVLRYDDGYDSELSSLLKADGYKVDSSHRQTSPNDGDDILYISWDE